MKPGPAFIPAPPRTLLCPKGECGTCRDLAQVPDGYIWQPATEHTGAGWVRPLGAPLATTSDMERRNRPICAQDYDGFLCGHCTECQI